MSKSRYIYWNANSKNHMTEFKKAYYQYSHSILSHRPRKVRGFLESVPSDAIRARITIPTFWVLIPCCFHSLKIKNKSSKMCVIENFFLALWNVSGLFSLSWYFIYLLTYLRERERECTSGGWGWGE